jgi:uncharacterized protein DUF6941
MEVEYAFIAEDADAQNGLFYVLKGGTDIWYTPPDALFPVGIGPMSFVVRLVGEPSEVSTELPVSFVIVDADSRPIGVQGEGQITFAPHPIDRTRTGGALIHFRMAIQAPAHGAYFFELHSDDRRLCQVPFWIVPAPEPAG